MRPTGIFATTSFAACAAIVAFAIGAASMPPPAPRQPVGFGRRTQNASTVQPPAPGEHGKKQARAKKGKSSKARAQAFAGLVEWEYKPFSWDCDVPNCDHFALYDDEAKMNYEIDDARAALPFEGKRVKLTGILNPKTGAIHLLSIQQLP